MSQEFQGPTGPLKFLPLQGAYLHRSHDFSLRSKARNNHVLENETHSITHTHTELLAFYIRFGEILTEILVKLD